MLSSTRTRIRAIRRQCPHRRGVAYSSKVRAFPFVVSPEEAKVDLSNNAFMARGFLKKISNRFPPVLEPAKLVPVYFPAWLIDAEIDVKATASAETESEDEYVSANFINSYVPGYLLDDLSSTSFLAPTLNIDKTVPFSAELETQFDTPISCLPFKTDPFSVLDLAKSLPSEHCHITPDLRIHPSTIQANLICAYPVLIPLYLAQYRGKASGVLQKVVTVVLQAHCEKGTILWGKREELFDIEHPFVAVPSPQKEAFLKQATERATRLLQRTGLEPPTPFFPVRGDAGNFANIASLATHDTWKLSLKNRFDYIIRWLHGLVSAGPLSLQHTANLDMDDPRIRPFTDEEVGAVRKYMSLGEKRAEVYALNNIVKGFPNRANIDEKLEAIVARAGCPKAGRPLRAGGRSGWNRMATQ
ncbi:hypothetical protein B0H16DRAFT_1511594 [Mycena metata]|uniref:Uncharacterized protein n=1 Tax=Mycena metata TaxID=1033252 RepID=A0AAD7JWH4_9AGAR|nr:hypothetical protein B0H16DRAFT_1511594 [Mycena metata]